MGVSKVRNLQKLLCLDSKTLLSSEAFKRARIPGAQYYDGKKLSIPVSTEAGIQLYERWVHQGISGIMSAVAKQRAAKLNEYERSRLYQCSKVAENIYQQAQCVSRVIDANSRPVLTEKRRWPHKFNKLLIDRCKETIGVSLHAGHLSFRTRRSVVSRKNVQLYAEYEHITPLGIVGKYLSKTVKIMKNKDPRSTSVSCCYHWT
ncbi:unnamed protein product [Gongylonema pulchrum]|uniref:Transposase n=1 Tax=Gongylonema pulchrum TaxID=637853 RepID=A0A183DCN8_9BILA|nr:unnamed protein product [Gongylonema pulchrum]